MTRNLLISALIAPLLLTVAEARKPAKHASSEAASVRKSVSKSAAKSKARTRTATTTRATRTRRATARRLTSGTYKTKRKFYSPWDTPTFADSTWGDIAEGEDPVVRRAAVQALGPYNGAVVVADPFTGRILSIVNQKLALTGAYQPCSTIKLVATLAGLNEGVIDKDTRLRLTRRQSIDLTWAIAHSNNAYFANIGEKLGFEKVNHWARLLGLGEKAGWQIHGESAGIFPDEKPKGVTVGLMTSFGEAIGLTPLQLTALVSAIANGGTLYYLQYPRTTEDAAQFAPRIKRKLEIADQIPDIRPGMNGAVEFGTARRAAYDASEPIYGKTGTCTDARTHLGWFGSFNEVGRTKLVVVVLLTGGSGVNGPVAAGIAGQVYKNLSEQQFFGQARSNFTPAVHGGDR